MHTVGLNHFLTFLVVAFASYRVTRVIVDDTITAKWRQWLWRHAYVSAGFDSRTEREVSMRRHGLVGWAWEKAFQLFTCPHCTGWWISLGLFAAWWWGSDNVRVAIAAVAVSGMQSLISSRRDA